MLCCSVNLAYVDVGCLLRCDVAVVCVTWYCGWCWLGLVWILFCLVLVFDARLCLVLVLMWRAGRVCGCCCGCVLWIAGCGLRVAGCGLWFVVCGLWCVVTFVICCAWVLCVGVLLLLRLTVTALCLLWCGCGVSFMRIGCCACCVLSYCVSLLRVYAVVCCCGVLRFRGMLRCCVGCWCAGVVLCVVV